MKEMLFFSAFGLGLALWAVPGAVTTEALRRGLAQRWWSVSFILLETIAGDALWASVSFIFAATLSRNTVLHGLLGALETIMLLSLAWIRLKEGWSVIAVDRRSMELLESEPEWHDGEIVYALK